MKNVLIIGASSGIGRQLASDLAHNNVQVYGTYLTSTDQLIDHPYIIYHKLDVCDPNLSMEFIPEALDGLVYCPGTIDLKPFHRIDPQRFSDDYNIQVVGAVRTIQKALPALKKGDNPSIIMFSTVAVTLGMNFHTLVSASKGAIEGFTKSLAAELAPSIRVNCIAPSLTDTPLAHRLVNTEAKIQANADRHPLKRIGTPQDISNLAQYLLSDKSGWMTGQILNIDGGLSRVKL